VIDRLGTRFDALLANLNGTVRSTNRLITTGQTLTAVEQQVGDRSPLLADIRNLVQQMDGAARSMRLMVEYLERNPSALIAGKSDNRRWGLSARGGGGAAACGLRIDADTGVRSFAEGCRCAGGRHAGARWRADLGG
jgi:hypothetical protein